MAGWQGLKPEVEMEPYEINYAVITDELLKHGQDIDSLRFALERADPTVFVEMVKVANENLSNPDALQKLGDTYAPNRQRLLEVKCLEASAEHLDMLWKFEVESGTFDARVFQEKLFLQTGFEFIIDEFTHGSAEIVGSFVPTVVQDLATANQPAALVPALLMVAAGITGGCAIRAVVASQRLNNLLVASFVCACFGASIGYAACVRATVRTAQLGAQVGASGGPTGALVGGVLGGIGGFLLAYIL
jgi:hypothetical protein